MGKCHTENRNNSSLNHGTGEQRMHMTMDALLSLLRSVLKNENIPQIKLTSELIAFCSSQQLIGFLYYGI